MSKKTPKANGVSAKKAPKEVGKNTTPQAPEGNPEGFTQEDINNFFKQNPSLVPGLENIALKRRINEQQKELAELRKAKA